MSSPILSTAAGRLPRPRHHAGAMPAPVPSATPAPCRRAMVCTISDIKGPRETRFLTEIVRYRTPSATCLQLSDPNSARLLVQLLQPNQDRTFIASRGKTRARDEPIPVATQSRALDLLDLLPDHLIGHRRCPKLRLVEDIAVRAFGHHIELAIRPVRGIVVVVCPDHVERGPISPARFLRTRYCRHTSSNA